MHNNSSPINLILEKSSDAFIKYQKLGPVQRKEFLFLMAKNLEGAAAVLIPIAEKETHLSPSRLNAELKRTAFQLRSYAGYMASGLALDIRIDTGKTKEQPPLPSLARMNVPLGPVAVFGASNFPFAYSTAGGDTACALAAGCPVIVKAHPAHKETSRAVSKIIHNTILELDLHPEIFQHIEGGFETGEALVKHPLLTAVGFTGSYSGGKQLFDWGNQREIPIPVFSEMGSVNPVFFLPQILAAEYENLATKLSDSIALDAGQFCTNPGIMIAIKSEGLENFKQKLASLISIKRPQAMLHEGIYENFERNKSASLMHKGVKIIAQANATPNFMEAPVMVTETSANYFLRHPQLQEEVFGPYSLLVVCEDVKEMILVSKCFKGQLTTSIFGSNLELAAHKLLLEIMRKNCGRLILNGVPTGVRVSTAMQHGGPFPATTDSRFSSVGGDGIRRFMRPVCFQGWPDELLPPELQLANPFCLWRLVDEEWQR